jgi:calcineurin-like phosphoesterase family protein
MTNIIFLDIDGVLNHSHFGKDENDKFGFADDCIQNLKKILIKVPSTKIVITSAWKHFTMQGFVDEDTQDWRASLCRRLDMPRETILDSTPSIDNGNRADEIAEWLKQNKVKIGLGTFVVLDDECIALKAAFPNNVVDCSIDTGEGLSERKANDAIWILSGFCKDNSSVQHWLVSDTHFFHANIIKYCNRPFKDAVDMNEELVKRWNSVVKPNDIVHHLGDFCFGKKENVLDILPKLNGKIDIVLGNHDHHKIDFYYKAGFHRVYDRPIVLRNFFILSHAPLEWISNDGPYANFFGHVHDSSVYKTVTSRSLCACVERWNYAPIKWEDAVEEMKKAEDHTNEVN